MLHEGLGPPLADDPGVVGLLVIAAEPGQDLARLLYVRPVLDLVGQGQQQRDQGLLVVRLHAQHVQADALGLPRLVQEPVALGPLEGLGHRHLGQELQLEHGPSWGIAAQRIVRSV